MARKKTEQADDEQIIDLTPMLDVTFIMLIFFIVTAVFVKEPGIDVERPQVVDLEKVKPVILVAVSNTDRIWVNKREMSVRELRPVIEGIHAENPKGVAVVQGDQDARFSVVYEVMEILRDAGIDAQFVSTLPE